MVKVKRKHIVSLFVAAVTLILIGFGLDNRLQTTHYDVYDNRVPAAFEGYKIAQLSDVHSQWFGEGQSALIAAVKAGAPDIIVLTGDIIDARIQDYDSVAALFAGLTKIAPVYAVSGNHEIDSTSILTQMNALYKEYGVNFLDDASATIVKGGMDIIIYGLDDRTHLTKKIPKVDSDTYGIMLFHRGNLFDSLVDAGYGLVFSGHTHGGLIRLPLVGGVLSPDATIDFTQKYSGGRYTTGTTTLILNRGMAGSHGIPRIFNRPEIVYVTLHQAA